MIRLAEAYASAIDEAHAIAEEARTIEPDDEDTAKVLRALMRRLDAGAVLAEIGPKLATALESLGASPKARAGLIGKGVSPGDSNAGKSKLDELRERKRVRQGRAAPVDSSSA